MANDLALRITGFPLATSGRAQLSVPDGIVAAQIVVIRREARRAVICELRVVNETDSAVATVFFLGGPSGTTPAGIDELSVPARSAIATMIRVPLQRRLRTDSVLAHVHGPNGTIVVETPLPKNAGSIAVQAAFSLSAGVVAAAALWVAMVPTASHTFALSMPPPEPGAVKIVRTAQITGFSLGRPQAQAGSSIAVDYGYVGDSGKLLLLDGSGTIWSQAEVNSHGHSALLAPVFSKDVPMRVVLRVSRGTTTATSSLGLIVAGAPVPAPAVAIQLPEQQPAAMPVAQTQAIAPAPPRKSTVTVADGPIALSGTAFRSGELIAIRSLRSGAPVHVTLLSGDGIELFAADITGSARSFRAPDVTSPSRFMVTASSRSGISQDTTVIPIIVSPR